MLLLVQAFVISRLVFSTPYLPLQRAELDKVNALIRKTYKVALSLSPSTSTGRLLKLGVHNTAEESAKAHFTAQYQRLSTSQADRHNLTSQQINFPSNPSHKCFLPLDIRQSLQVSPIP
uniref:Putative tick transposon n=1 Tax=Ixodes ricinus TaxID=34613 RepID=A0A6B0UMH6_IXORI